MFTVLVMNALHWHWRVGLFTVVLIVSILYPLFPLLSSEYLDYKAHPLIDSPGKTIGSDFNGDGVHDFIVGARGNNDGGAGNEGAAYVFFGSTTLSGTKLLGGGDSADVTFLGKGSDDELGTSVSSAGDLNGDGIDDLVVGADYNDDTGVHAGAAYVVFGATSLSGTFDLGGGVQSVDVTILGKLTGDHLGRGTSSAGDVNGDGFDDVIVGAFQNTDGANDAGATYIFFGSTSLSGTKDLSGIDSPDVTFLGKGATDFLGIYNSGVGDINGDGFDDVFVGAMYNEDGAAGNGGAAYVFFGASNLSGTKDTGNADEDVQILGKGSGDRLGVGISGVGDINGDGFDDFMVGGDRNNDGGSDDEGAVYIFFGASDFSGPFDLEGGVKSPNVTIFGKSTNDYLGRNISGAGDINDDGFDDILLGARGNDDGGANNEGAGYIFFGSRTLSGTKQLGGGDSADVTILGKGATDLLGGSVSSIGDTNADGIADIIIGAYQNNDGGTDDEGAAYVFFGSTTLSGTKRLGGVESADVTILGKGTNDFLGRGIGGGRKNPGP